jgi:glycosyltransferase involved in cell wall biosynthesis
LVKRGHEVTVVTTNVDGNGISNVEVGVPVDIDGVKVWYFPSNFLRKIYYSPKMKSHILRTIHAFDFIHLHSVFLWPTNMVAKIAKRSNISYCISPRGALVKGLIRKKSFIVKWLWIAFFERSTLRGAAFIHATSDVESNNIKEFRLLSTKIIANGVNIPTIKENSSNVRQLLNKYQVINQEYIIFIGRISWKKSLDRLIIALKDIEKVDLLVVGNDEDELEDELKDIAIENNVNSRVYFIGPVYGEEKFYLLKGASLLVLPSHNENFGNVVLEALAVGTPVAVTSGVGAASILKKSNSGIVVSNSPFLMAQEINALLQNKNELKSMGLRGKDVVNKSFSWLRIAEEMENAYMECVR